MPARNMFFTFDTKLKVELPTWVCHSANPSGVENMSGLLLSFMKLQLKNDVMPKK